MMVTSMQRIVPPQMKDGGVYEEVVSALTWHCFQAQGFDWPTTCCHE